MKIFCIMCMVGSHDYLEFTEPHITFRVCICCKKRKIISKKPKDD